jgi:hypothetical protein
LLAYSTNLKERNRVVRARFDQWWRLWITTLLLEMDGSLRWGATIKHFFT